MVATPTASESPLLPNLQKDLNVLVVDPDPLRRKDLKTRLQASPQVRMCGARNTPHFLMDTISENIVDVILYDLDVGWESILDSVRELRALPAGERIGYVVLSERVTPEMIYRGSQVGMLGYLRKPCNLMRLEKAMRDALGVVDPRLQPVLEGMREAPFFAGFGDRELLRLLNICRTRRFRPGDYVFREGEHGESLYVLLRGSVEIRKHMPDGEHRLLATLPAGTCFGEMAILDNDPRSADAVAGEAALVFEINQKTLTEDDNVLSLKLSRQIGIELANKIRAINQRR